MQKMNSTINTKDCWLWSGSTDRNGYPQRKWGDRNYMIHRLMYQEFVGVIPTGYTIDHLCKTPQCINPEHLEPVTLSENILRSDSFSAMNARKLRCNKGHIFTQELYGNQKRRRRCRICLNEQRRQKYAEDELYQ